MGDEWYNYDGAFHFQFYCRVASNNEQCFVIFKYMFCYLNCSSSSSFMQNRLKFY
jgi:hypothetical protein